MASTYSTNLKIELIGTGEQAGTWGNTTNTNLGTALEQAVVGKADVAMSSTTVTLTLTNSNSAQNARAIYLNLTGSPGGAATLVVPAIEKPYIVKNGSNQQVTIKVSGLTGVPIPTGKTALVYNNGTDVVTAVDHIPSLTLGAALPIASGGTGSTSTTYVNLTTNVTGTLPVANGGTGVTASTGTGNVVLSASPTFTGTISAVGLNITSFIDLADNDILRFGTSDDMEIFHNGTDNFIDLNVGNLIFRDGTTTRLTLARTTGALTFTGALNCADQLVNRPVLQDYAIEGSAIGNAGATREFNLTNGNFFSVTIDQATTFTFSNPPASGDFGCFVMEITNGSAFLITFPASVDWPGGTAPTLTASGVDQLVFTTRDGGTTYFGFVAGLDIKSPTP